MISKFRNLIRPYDAAADLPPLPTKLWPFFWHFLKQDKKAWVILAIFGLVNNALDGAQFIFLKWLVDLTVSADKTPETLHSFIWVIVGFAALRCLMPLMGYVTDALTWTLRPLFANKVRAQLFAQILKQPLSYFEKDFAGRLSSKIMETPYAMVSFVSSIINDISWSVLTMLATLVAMFYVHWIFGVVTLIFYFTYAVLLKHFMPHVLSQSEKAYDTLSITRGRVVDAITNILPLKLFARSSFEKTLLDSNLNAVSNDFIKMGLTNAAMRTGLEILLGLYMLVCAGITYYVAANNYATAGDISMIWAFIMRLTGALFWMLHLAGHLFENLGQITEGMQALSVKPALTDAENAPKLTVKSASISFNNVTFAYNQEPLFEGFNLTIPHGQKVGVLGPSGAGKTSLIKVLLRLYDVQNGGIFIDGQNIATVQQDSLRESIALIPQLPELLHRSIRDNISYGRIDASEADIVEAAKAAGAHEFILRLTDHKGNTGYNALVGERGVKLSGGQRQRIALARAVLKNAPILILDEATSSLDSESERIIQAGLKHAMAGRTVIAIAHRLSTIAELDRLIVLDKGKIVEDGTHAELLAKGGLYAKLWAMQSGNFIPADKE